MKNSVFICHLPFNVRRMNMRQERGNCFNLFHFRKMVKSLNKDVFRITFYLYLMKSYRFCLFVLLFTLFLCCLYLLYHINGKRILCNVEIYLKVCTLGTFYLQKCIKITVLNLIFTGNEYSPCVRVRACVCVGVCVCFALCFY